MRQRHDLPRGDLDRIVRQQAYMASLVQSMLSAGTLTNPAKLRELSNAAERSVTLDKGWDIVGLAQQLSGLAGGNVTFTTIPVTSVNGVGDYGESIVTVDLPQVQKFMAEAIKPEEDNTDGTEGSDGSDSATSAPREAFNGYEAVVLNAGSVPGQAGRVAEILNGDGLTVTSVSNAMEGLYTATQVLAADENDPAAQELAQLLGGVPVVANASVEPNTVIAVIADDYNGPGAMDADEAEQVAPVGTPGEDFGANEPAPELSAGEDSPRCVN